MFKHANTVFPNDRVRSANTKVASKEPTQSGQVKDVHDGKAKVAWDDGTVTWDNLENLVKE